MNTTNEHADRELIARFYTEVLNKSDFDLIDKYVSPEYRNGSSNTGSAAFKSTIQGLLTGFPDGQWQIHDLIAGDGKVVVLQQFTGTHQAKFQQYEPTGKSVAVAGIAIYTLKDGKIVHSRVDTDRLSFLQAIDVIPQDLNQYRNSTVSQKS